MKYDRIAAMNKARERKPASGGKIYKQVAPPRPVNPERSSWDYLKGITLARWDHASGTACEDYRFAIHGNEWLEGFAP